MVNVHCAGLTDTVDIVAREVYQHDMFCPVLLGRQQFCTKLFIL